MCALEALNVALRKPQVLVLAPTREIAFQIHDVMVSVGQHKGVVCHPFIGGLAIADDVLKTDDCHVLVGTPGRVLELVAREHVDLSHVRVFIMDEADKLLSGSLQTQTT